MVGTELAAAQPLDTVAPHHPGPASQQSPAQRSVKCRYFASRKGRQFVPSVIIVPLSFLRMSLAVYPILVFDYGLGISYTRFGSLQSSGIMHGQLGSIYGGSHAIQFVLSIMPHVLIL